MCQCGVIAPVPVVGEMREVVMREAIAKDVAARSLEWRLWSGEFHRFGTDSRNGKDDA